MTEAVRSRYHPFRDGVEMGGFLIVGISTFLGSVQREGVAMAFLGGMLMGALIGVGLLRLLRLFVRRKPTEPAEEIFVVQTEPTPRRRGNAAWIAVAGSIVVVAVALALLSGPSSTQLHNRGNAHYAAGRFAEAVRAYGAALEKEPDSAVTHYGIGLAYGRMRHYDQAAYHFREALRLRPGYIEASRALSITQSNIEARAQR